MLKHTFEGNGLSFNKGATNVVDAFNVVIGKQRFPYMKGFSFVLVFHVLMFSLVLVPHQTIGATEGRT